MSKELLINIREVKLLWDNGDEERTNKSQTVVRPQRKEGLTFLGLTLSW